MEKSYTRKQVAEIIKMPERSILYYTERSVITADVDPGVGRGKIRRYSRNNLIEIAVLKEFANLEISLGLIRTAMQCLHAKMIPVEEFDADNELVFPLISIGDAIGRMEPGTSVYLCALDAGGGNLTVKWVFSIEDVGKILANSDAVVVVNYSKILRKFE